jgi:hypothetical protein
MADGLVFRIVGKEGDLHQRITVALAGLVKLA